jgi:uncharacterized membrane protein YeaQ/YmgE (transglycosylase-associated protein family)
MSLLMVLIVGGIVGWLAAAVAGRDEGVIGSITIGVVGALIGSVLANIFGASGTYLSVSWSGLFWTFVGALILSVLLNAIQRRHSHSV